MHQKYLEQTRRGLILRNYNCKIIKPAYRRQMNKSGISIKSSGDFF